MIYRPKVRKFVRVDFELGCISEDLVEGLHVINIKGSEMGHFSTEQLEDFCSALTVYLEAVNASRSRTMSAP